MRPESIRILNLLQLISEIAIGVGYLIGLVPFAYLWSSAWVIPLTIVSIVLAYLTNNGTQKLTLINLALSLLSYIPLVGYLFRAAGCVVSWMNLRALTNGRRGY